jgi:hypothetical protein
MDMLRMTRRKALNTGMREAERALMMFFRLERRPKMRMTRKARTTRRMETGMSSGPREMRERTMTTLSMRLYWLLTKGVNQCAKALRRSSAVKMLVKKMSSRSRKRPDSVKDPSSVTSCPLSWACETLMRKFCEEGERHGVTGRSGCSEKERFGRGGKAWDGRAAEQRLKAGGMELAGQEGEPPPPSFSFL